MFNLNILARTLYRINLLSSEKNELERFIRKHSTPQHIAKRARIILLANEHVETNQVIADTLGISKADVTRWTKRWIDRAMEPVLDRISDLPRPGHPDMITPEQWCQIIAMACEPPEKYGRPITHWSSAELASEAIKQGIVESLSSGHLRKVLKKKICNPTAAAIG